jgi:hypothetical protein
VGQLLEGVSDEASFFEARLAFPARTDVGFERGNAKALLAVEEQVDLSGEQVPMIHRVSSKEVYGAELGPVSAVSCPVSDLTGHT